MHRTETGGEPVVAAHGLELLEQRRTERSRLHVILQELGHDPFPDQQVRLRHVQRATAGKDLMDKFERIVLLDGDLSAEQRQRLLEIAEKCPVSTTLRQGSEIASLLEPSSS